eukprot:INCI15943.1.p1 GENE.INCI15943.1~~INCI15943.1.p1  ORF type:complete len:298 (-),score=50.33 INCI15943.1:1277-2170(-)
MKQGPETGTFVGVGLSSTSTSTLPEINQAAVERHARVTNCLFQCESMNLKRPKGVQTTTNQWLPTHKPVANTHNVNEPHARMVAARAHEELQQVLQQRHTFRAEALKLRKRVTRAVHLISQLAVLSSRAEPVAVLVHDHSERELIQAAIDDHHVSQKTKLRDVKAALRLLHQAVKSREHVTPTKMKTILSKLHVDRLLELSRESRERGLTPKQVLEHVHTKHEVWTQENRRGPQEPCRLHRPKVRKGSHFADSLTTLRHVASAKAMPHLHELQALPERVPTPGREEESDEESNNQNQ